jgi:hypothetical protein
MIKLLRRLFGKNESKETVAPVADNSETITHAAFTTDESQEQQPVAVAQDPENSAPTEVAEIQVAENAAIELAPVTVSPRFDRTKLEAMKKADLEELAKKHGVSVKARAKKDELVEKLSQL